MNLISYKEFEKLRLKQFLPKNEITRVWNFEFMGKLWLGEVYGFTEFLRPLLSPFKTRSISISLEDLPEKTWKNMLAKLKLRFAKNSSLEEIESHLGKPVKIEKFTEDRLSYEFITGEKTKFYISCTLLTNGGLIYLVISNQKHIISEFDKKVF
ncbi:MAG: hypothetical protein Sapg2KO_27680 [Saprospiraceae bacterium]